ncbi:hypothetical protein A9K55_000279 [Cordyceps militaris]|uniref:Uncharacterized protein n=1 Tax=Cordyceps militaris TaxID=73501 RepID=A0A2H4SVG6_CORMI|nr:hypothetical protein A9K55_000279 [Cordyceps militaris]
MAEMLGVVAAAAQLAGLCASLLTVLKKVKGAGLTLESWKRQLEDLSLLSASISRNPLLQTSEIACLTQSLSALIQQADIGLILEKNRLSRALYVLRKERDLFDTLAALERQKLSLSLSMEQIQSGALHEIRARVQDMSYENSNFWALPDALAVESAQSPADSLMLDVGSSMPDADWVCPRTSPADLPRASQDSPMMLAPDGTTAAIVGSGHQAPAAAELRTQPEGVSIVPLRSDHHELYTTSGAGISGVTCHGNVNQFVGSTFSGTASELPHVTNDMTIANIGKCGQGDQLVGFWAEYEGCLEDSFNHAAVVGTIRGVTHRGVDAGGRRGRQKVGVFVTHRG